MNSLLKRTSLYERHVAGGGKIVPFAGFEMPVQYQTGIIAEHAAVRETAGLLMSLIWVNSSSEAHKLWSWFSMLP